MTIFVNYVKRIFRNKIQAFFILLFPLLFMSIGLIEGEPALKAAVIDNDQTPLTADLILQLTDIADMGTIAQDEIEQKLRSLSVEYVLVIERGFTDRLIGGESGGVIAYSVKESNTSAPARAFLEQQLDAARSIAAAVDHDSDIFYSEWANYREQPLLEVAHHSFADDRERSKRVIGFFIVAMMYTAMVVSLYVLINRNNHTLLRTIAAPVTLRKYTLQMIGSFIVVSWIQIVIVMLFMQGVYGVDLGGSAWSIFVLLLLFSLVCVSLATAVSSFSRNMVQACLIGMCLIVPMAMLGGAYFPIDGVSDVIDAISKFSPITWTMAGVDRLLAGEGLMAIGRELSIVLLFAVVFFLLASWRKSNGSGG